MQRIGKNLVKIAVAQLGYFEKETCVSLDSNTANAGDGNHTKYARDLRNAGYYSGVDKCGLGWCDVFVDWCFYTLCDNDPDEAQRMICQTGPYGAVCTYSAQYYKNAGRYYTSNPLPGDQVFFGSTTINHTGIVESVNGNTITTIEGNTSDRVARRTYNLSNTYIKGFGRPIYDNENTATNNNPTVVIKPSTTTPSTGNSSTNSASSVDGIYTVKSGDGWWSIAQSELGSGARMTELATFNGMTTKTMLHPNDKLKIPGKYKEKDNSTNTNNSNKNTIKGYNEEAGTYTVQPGDGWWSIASKTMGSGLKMYTLAKHNGMSITTMLHPNNVIKIPK